MSKQTPLKNETTKHNIHTNNQQDIYVGDFVKKFFFSGETLIRLYCTVF